MKRLAIALLATAAVSPALAQEHRELGAHEHGVGRLEIAVEGSRIAIGLEAPGADIVGFEHAASSAGDRAALDQAIAVLEKPLELFVLPGGAQCVVTEAAARLVDEEEHEHEAHDDKAHEGEKHADHGHEAQHTEFRANYVLTCASPAALTGIEFAYFKLFPNARELEIRLISEKGAKSFEVGRDAPALDLKGQL
ncbi:hypothetical protein FHS82_003570 [Pseudochelatococcus lubricantis]|uniref:DUF2796 domain-containing protein n=1 Tax=Pseudochelatococcus lubricantis TaxID=1538102 RepID=A0ABX0V6I5_9HYPH|nr:DUF2796 domain-containing protein [Pseudochelatococcus lubricantis]NIJ59709.1 hypothetical protein [Pseudochelatococcus lubricantis]